MSESAAKIERYEKALREIGLPEHVPQGFDPLDWWRFKACKRGEIARDALGVTAEDLIRDQCGRRRCRVSSAARTYPKIGLARERGCTCRPEVVAAKPKDGRYIGHEASCRLHWKAVA